MTLIAPVTTSPTFSFYVGTSRPQLILDCARHADGVTVSGRRGPEVVRRLRRAGFEGAVLFDRGDAQNPDQKSDAAAWVAEQIQAGAARVLTPGAFVPWTPDDLPAGLAFAEAEIADGREYGAIPLLSIDVHWLAKQPALVASTLAEAHGPVAIILADPSDPLKLAGAVAGLRLLAQALPRLLILRADHGALGGLAYGAEHAALGLNTSNRHGGVPGRPPFAKRRDFTARVFSLGFGDWFTAFVIASWSLADPRFGVCPLPCCGGAPLSRFLDEDLAPEVEQHNIQSLACLADLVVNAPAEMRRGVFLDYCRDAVLRYDLNGSNGPTDPKPQLTAWALS